MKDVFERMRTGENIPTTDPDYPILEAAMTQGMQTVAELNASYHTPDEVRSLLSRLMQQEIDPSVRLFPPFHTVFGRFTSLGKGVFINSGCTFLDMGGITIEDDVYIAPDVKLLTEYHPEAPTQRHNLLTKPIVIRRNAWIGAGAIILPGVTIGENAIVGAGSIVRHDVEANTIVGGNPAKFLRFIKEN